MKLTSQKVSFGEKVGYSMGGGSANLIFQMMMMFQLFFYTDVFGIKATAAGIILAFAFFIGVILLFFYPITKKLNEQVQSELEIRRQEL